MISADVNEVESEVDTVPRLLPEVQRPMNPASSDTNAEGLNDSMEMEDDPLIDFGGIGELVTSDFFGFQNARLEAANTHYQALAQSSQQTTSSGNNSVCQTFIFTDATSDIAPVVK